MTETPTSSMPSDPHVETVRQHYAAIGMAAAEWAALEMAIDFYALTLALIPTAVGGCFTSQISGSTRKLDTYIAVAQLSGATKNVRALHNFAKDTAGMAERRNRIVHDPWLFDTEGAPRRFEVTARRKLRSLAIPVPTDEVWNLAEEIREHCARLDRLHGEVMAELGRINVLTDPD